MTSLGVSDVQVQDGTAWCQVVCRRGVLRVGNQLTSVTRPDGSTVQVNLTVESIELSSGPVMELEAYLAGRVRLTGPGVEAILAGSTLENAREWQFAADGGAPMPTPAASARSTRSYAYLPESERPRLLIDEAVQLSRVTTAFRLVLAIPQLIVMWLLSWAVSVVVLIGWFAALVTGRLPEWAGDFLENCLEYQARLSGYLHLVSDEYPPFTLSQVRYPVHLQLPQRGRLNRWSVLFRGVLILPALVVSTLATLGWTVAAIVIWMVVLVKGRFPTMLFSATVAVLRFSLRTSAYGYLLTTRYPRGLFGDGTEPEYGDAPVPTEFTGEPSAAAGLTDGVRLSRGARTLVAGFLVLGVIGSLGYVALGVAAANAPTRASALADLTDARQKFGSESAVFRRAVNACPRRAARLACVEAAVETFAAEADRFRSSVDGIDHPGESDELFEQMSTTAGLFASGFHQLAKAPTPKAYNDLAAKVDLGARGGALDRSYAALVDQLSR